MFEIPCRVVVVLHRMEPMETGSGGPMPSHPSLPDSGWIKERELGAGGFGMVTLYRHAGDQVSTHANYTKLFETHFFTGLLYSCLYFTSLILLNSFCHIVPSAHLRQHSSIHIYPAPPRRPPSMTSFLLLPTSSRLPDAKYL